MTNSDNRMCDVIDQSHTRIHWQMMSNQNGVWHCSLLFTLNAFAGSFPDISLGDLVGAKSMRDTYLGLGVSHRSGIFGNSRLFGNVNGGSNYIYSYLEWRM